MKEFVIEHYKQNGLPLDELIIFGVRNPENFELDRFNDFLGFIFENKIHVSTGTTDPGVYYTKNPMNSGGAFHMDLGFHSKIWRLRKHRNKYLALCNDHNCNKVRGYRDSDLNKIIHGWVFTNLHTTSQDEFINLSSAGCQVTPEEEWFEKLIRSAKVCDQDRFSYNLFHIKDIPTNLIVNGLIK